MEVPLKMCDRDHGYRHPYGDNSELRRGAFRFLQKSNRASDPLGLDRSNRCRSRFEECDAA